MTREEAIKLLCVERSTIIEVDGNKGAEKMLQAYDMAIEALSAEESVTLYATPKATYIRPLTEEIAIEFLQDSGWLPNHDKEIGNPPMLVRCKDCRHAYFKDFDKYCPYMVSALNPDGYCSKGERREKR